MWKIGVERFCEGCQKRHASTVWYCRRSADPVTREWLCGIKYLVLAQEDMDVWQMFPVLP